MKSIVVCVAFALVFTAGATPVDGTDGSGPVPSSLLCLADQPCDRTPLPLFVDLGGGFVWLPEPTGSANAGIVEELIREFTTAGTQPETAAEQDGGVSPLRLGKEVGALLLDRASSLPASGRIVEEDSEPWPGFSMSAMVAAGLLVLGLLWLRRLGALPIAFFVLVGSAASLGVSQRQHHVERSEGVDRYQRTLGTRA
jgi:hypothetical protein